MSTGRKEKNEIYDSNLDIEKNKKKKNEGITQEFFLILFKGYLNLKCAD